MLSKFLIAVVVFILLWIVLILAGVPYAGLIALAGGIIAFIMAPARTTTRL